MSLGKIRKLKDQFARKNYLHKRFDSLYNRETDYRNEKNLELYFDFYKWKPKLLVKFFKKHTTKYPSNYWDRIDKINKGCKYSFEKSNFNIVKVTIK